MIPLKLGWSNPDCGPCSLRLYALDRDDIQPRWAKPHARVAEVPLILAGTVEGERYVLLTQQEFAALRADLARALPVIEAAERVVSEYGDLPFPEGDDGSHPRLGGDTAALENAIRALARAVKGEN